jgi:putative membrane protein
MLFAFAGSLKTFALPALLVYFTAGRSQDPAPFVGRWMPWANISNSEFWLLLFLVPSAIAAVARYLSFRVRYEGTELVIRSGILFRNERHVPYLRIQNLDTSRNVVHRLLGVTNVRVETGGGQEPEATISVLDDKAFDEMRRRVFEGRARAASVEPASDVAPVAAPEETLTLLHLPLRELLLHGFLENRGLIIIGAAYGALWQFGVAGAVWERLTAGWDAPRLVNEALQEVESGHTVTLVQVAVLIAGLVGILVLVRLVSMAWAAMRLYDFRLSLAGQDLRAEYGLLTRVSRRIPLPRVQTLTVRETPLQRLVGRMSVRVETAGGLGPTEGGARPFEREWLAPIVETDRVPALVRQVLPGFEIDALMWQSVHSRAFRRAVKPSLFLAVVGVAALVGVAGWWMVAAAPLAITWAVIASRKQVQHMGWAITEHAVVFRSGWLWRHVTVAPIAKIQTVVCSESPFDRRAAMRGVRVDTAGGNERSHRVVIPYLGRDTANVLHARLAAQISRTAFRW